MAIMIIYTTLDNCIAQLHYREYHLSLLPHSAYTRTEKGGE